MKAELKLEDPDALEATISITLTVGRWRKLAAAVEGQKYHTLIDEFLEPLREVISQADRTFSAGGNHGK